VKLRALVIVGLAVTGLAALSVTGNAQTASGNFPSDITFTVFSGLAPNNAWPIKRLGHQVWDVAISRNQKATKTTVRLFMPGLRVTKLTPIDNASRTSPLDCKKLHESLSPGGIIFGFDSCPARTGFGIHFETQAVAPLGSHGCTKAVATLATGQSQTFKMGCYTIKP
jgi:hypothetical protein